MIEKIIRECEDEEIQFFNRIHNFGYLIAIEKESSRIKFVSENITDLTHFTTDINLILNEKYSTIFDFEIDFKAISDLELGLISKEYFTFNNKNYFCVVYPYQEYFYIEFEEDKKIGNSSSFYHNSEQLLYTKNKKENWEVLIHKIKELTGYNRVLIYKFLEDKCGKVIYETVDQGFDQYLGLHFPEFDIPAQARELYLKKRNRIVADIDATTTKIISATNEKLDLTYSEFRALSPIHLRYLSNFNVKASFSISIVVNNKLWGIVSCHHTTPKHIPINVRKQCEALVRIARVNFVKFKFEEQLKHQEKFQKVMVKLKEELLIQDSNNYSINSYIPLLKFTNADGVAFVKHQDVQTFACTPMTEEILRIRDWAKQHYQSELFYSNTFYKDYRKELSLSLCSAGVAFRFLDPDFNYFIIWFKKQYTEELKWAGKPEKVTVEDVFEDKVIQTFQPRSNFEIWKSASHKTSKVWKRKQINVITQVNTLILDTIHIKAFKIKELYEQLKEINAEMDSFSYTISHDLRTPLTVMRLNCQLLERSLKDDAQHAFHIKEVIGQIDRLSNMMEEILQLSKLKNTDLNLQTIDAKALISRIVEEAKIYNSASTSTVIIENTLDFNCDQTMAYEIFLNLINNALKYSSKVENPEVIISASSDDSHIIYRVKDNGIGIKEADRGKMFKLFSRMSNTSGFSGNGVGLSIVHRLLQRLEGTIDFISEENKGTEFIVKFKK